MLEEGFLWFLIKLNTDFFVGFLPIRQGFEEVFSVLDNVSKTN